MALIPTQATVTVGGRTMIAQGIVILTAFSQAVPNHIAGFSEDGGITAYQVPNGKTLRILAIKATQLTTGFSAGQIGSGTAAVALGGQATYPAGDVPIPYLEPYPNPGTQIGDSAELPCNLTVGQNRYLYGLGGGGQCEIQIFGYLE